MARCPLVLLHDREVDLTTGHIAPGSALTAKELALVDYLAQRMGQPVSRRVLLTEVWGFARPDRTQTLEQTIRRVRVKIEADPRNPRHLRTVRGVGYQLDAALADASPRGVPDAPPADAPEALSMGRAAIRCGRLEAARPLLQQAIDRGDPAVRAEAQRALACVLGVDRTPQARALLEAALAGFRDLGDREGEARAGVNLAAIARIGGDRTAALGHLDRALSAARSAGSAIAEVAVAEMGRLALETEGIAGPPSPQSPGWPSRPPLRAT